MCEFEIYCGSKSLTYHLISLHFSEFSSAKTPWKGFFKLVLHIFITSTFRDFGCWTRHAEDSGNFEANKLLAYDFRLLFVIWFRM
ncbi:hypothetical protein V6Z11_A01G192000 [Gossypium hirsutum]